MRLVESCPVFKQKVKGLLSASMVRVLFSILIFSFMPAIAAGQSEHAPGGAVVDDAIAAAERHFRSGENCLKEGNTDCARREFDLAIDSILDLRVDVRSHERLRAGYRELVERINRLETAPGVASASAMWRTQDFDGKPPALKAEVSGAEFDYPDGPLTAAEFQRRFAELRNRFREKYDRDITLTGADHGEHRRLYGRGSAFDVRARDLTREQVRFIIAAGNSLGLRIKDFSTWDKVAAHNARTLFLGRPLDTLATGIHLHIDRMSPPKKRQMTSTDSVMSRLRKAGKVKEN
jgi:hypothetical protein